MSDQERAEETDIGDPGSNADDADVGSFRALERLRQEADGIDTLVRLVPEWAEPGIQWVFEFDYIGRRRQILAKRDELMELHRSGCQKIRTTYGGIITRVLNRRSDGDVPRFDIKQTQQAVDDAKTTLDVLYDDLDRDYLSLPEQRELQALESDIDAAREYLRNKRALDEFRVEISKKIATFDDRYERYSDGDRYMISEDEAFLTETAKEIHERFSSQRRHLMIHLLPEPDVKWFGDTHTRFEGLSERLPHYNDWYVNQERSKYENVLTSDRGPLNEQQQKAVVRNDIRNLVDASAGTGKTLTLTHRYLYLLEKGHSPSDIVAITYTRDARDEMKSRIAKQTGIPEKDLLINTIHGFGNEILSTEAGTANHDADPGDALDQLVEEFYEYYAAKHESEYSILFSELADAFSTSFEKFVRLDKDQGYSEKNRGWRTSVPEFRKRKLVEFVESARTFDLSPSEIRQQLTGSDELRDAFGAAAASLTEAYLQIVDTQNGAVDYDEMIYGAADILEAHSDEFAKKYDHLLVDEFQDVSDAEIRLINALIGERGGPHLFCVGDDWQSIYGFAGSDVTNFTQFTKKYRNVTYTELQINYRCPPDIVNAGVELMSKSEEPQNSKSVIADNDAPCKPKLHLIEDDYDDEAPEYVADLISKKLDKEFNYDEIMILGSNDDGSPRMGDLRDKLRDMEIPHSCSDDPDHLPSWYEDELEYPIEMDNGDAKYLQTADVPEELAGERVPLVQVQSIHKSKGTEAPVVILLDALDDTLSGLPRSERVDRLLEPANAISADRVAEERRLCYVALTRCETEFHAISQTGNISRYLTDIDEWFTRLRRDWLLVGTVTEISYPDPDTNRPIIEEIAPDAPHDPGIHIRTVQAD